MPTAFLMVGLPAAGKTHRAGELAAGHGALRFTPDEWLIPLVGHAGEDGARDVLEGRFLWLGLDALRLGLDVVFDFGFWSRIERAAVRHLVNEVDARSEIVYLPIEPEQQLARVTERFGAAPETTFSVTAAELDAFAAIFEPPSDEELREEVAPEVAPAGGWRAWAARRWPSFPVLDGP